MISMTPDYAFVVVVVNEHIVGARALFQNCLCEWMKWTNRYIILRFGKHVRTNPDDLFKTLFNENNICCYSLNLVIKPRIFRKRKKVSISTKTSRVSRNPSLKCDNCSDAKTNQSKENICDKFIFSVVGPVSVIHLSSICELILGIDEMAFCLRNGFFNSKLSNSDESMSEKDWNMNPKWKSFDLFICKNIQAFE